MSRRGFLGLLGCGLLLLVLTASGLYAQEGDDIVGMSVMDFPPTRGIPWTAFTATARRVRGRGIARALKYETMAQAIELGYKRVRTANDGENEPILHINRKLGYRLVIPIIEMHRPLQP